MGKQLVADAFGVGRIAWVALVFTATAAYAQDAPRPSSADDSVVLTNLDEESREPAGAAFVGSTDQGSSERTLPVGRGDVAPVEKTVRSPSVYSNDAPDASSAKSRASEVADSNSGNTAGSVTGGAPQAFGYMWRSDVQPTGSVVNVPSGNIASSGNQPVIPPPATASILDNPDLLNARLAQYRDHMLNDASQANGMPSNPAIVRRYLATNRSAYMGSK